MKKTLLLASTTAAFSVVVGVIAQNVQPSPFPRGIGPNTAQAPVQVTVQPQPVQPQPAPFPSPQAMQAEFLRRFEASPGFGFSRTLRPVFTAPAPALVWNNTTYPVATPRLLALEDEPIAYEPREMFHRGLVINTNQPRSEVRKQFTHRPLTSLETNAVLALREGRDVVVFTNRAMNQIQESQAALIDTKPSLFVLGALRASKTCAACHQCKEGTLLGAFAYTLTPLHPPAGLDIYAVPSNSISAFDIRHSSFAIPHRL